MKCQILTFINSLKITYIPIMLLRVVLNYETKSKRNERNETKYYETQRNILKCETKRKYTKIQKEQRLDFFVTSRSIHVVLFGF
jgi:hypothetical protein